MSVNKVILLGHLGKDPEVKTAASGVVVAKMSLATNRVFYDKSGRKVEETEWHQLVAFGKHAENIGKYCSQGKQLFIEGRLQTRKWQDRDGKDRWTTEVVVEGVRFLSGGSRQERRPSNSSPPPAASAQEQGSRFSDDDIPF